jgi:hypothetical protein
MKRVRLLPVIGLFALALGPFLTAQTTEYYVDAVSGSDSNSGTSSSSPWKSLSKVNGATFSAGTNINFKRGGVWQGQLNIKSTGTSSSPVTYQAYGTGNAPQIKNPGVSYGKAIDVTGDYNVIKDFLLTDAHEAGIKTEPGADHNTVSNLEVTASGTGVYARSQYNLIIKNYVHDLTMIVDDTSPSNDYGAACYWLEGANNEVAYNRGINCRAHSYDFGYDGGFVEVFNQGDNAYIHHNWAEGTNGFFELGAGGGGSAQNIRVAYNVILNVKGSPGICFNGGSYNINTSNFRFENNTVVVQSGDGALYRIFGCKDDLTAMHAHNNVFYSDTQIANNGNFDHTNNLYYMTRMVNGSGVGYSLGSGERNGDPLFVNMTGKDFHLKSGSPAIDAGALIGLTKDFEDRLVPVGAGADMGAFEFGGTTAIPSAPTNLRITP